MKLKWLGHSAFEFVSDEGIDILVDPFIRANPSCKIPIDDLNPDVICITHGHADHFGDAVEIARNSNSFVVCNYEISNYLQRKGIDAIGINVGAVISLDGINIRMLDARHSSSYDFEMDRHYFGRSRGIAPFSRYPASVCAGALQSGIGKTRKLSVWILPELAVASFGGKEKETK